MIDKLSFAMKYHTDTSNIELANPNDQPIDFSIVPQQNPDTHITDLQLRKKKKRNERQNTSSAATFLGKKIECHHTEVSHVISAKYLNSITKAIFTL